MDVDRVRTGVAVVSVAALVGAVAWLSTSDRVAKPMPVNGDVLGRDHGESLDDYRERAAASLVSAPAGDAGFALVTFRDPQPAAAAAEVLEQADIGRVSALVLEGAVPVALPEPTGDEGRAEVFDRTLTRIGNSLGTADGLFDPRLRGVVVWDDGTALRGLGTVPEVLAVEVLPPDAAWGRIGVQPVIRPE
ncbi:hypothetical protein [Corynebacterium pygosceleis]|uniref:Uncharacterized protein n=1 Tax=Corynebacterium pygosceleis TaxID=2800406 RepID=A0A9Q4GKH6_9CORY|nr:hypothetical protein [Corynebacterium pygosceleis]MCK7636667.1 hypothetical protein [Corynebacterium pygosceleis]MCK7674154.1 hypothetical protein [Corynebacterium pygosceleis]MCL0120544.1 hypothetical protein [Corynebacterium pygosceleis]MCX7444095.1 hypothetical protein [Corynebacterium pygosceleis]MCX7467420.1 hypothetical protein [Corynebacterium pygosceleis]